MPGNTRDVLNSWSRDDSLTNQKERWRIVPACICSTVCQERNHWNFVDKKWYLQKLKMNYFVLYCFWSKQECLVEAEDIFNVLDNNYEAIQIGRFSLTYDLSFLFRGNYTVCVVYQFIYKMLPLSRKRKWSSPSNHKKLREDRHQINKRRPMMTSQENNQEHHVHFHKD